MNLDGHYSCATDKDIELWEKRGREDILEWVDPIFVGDKICI